MTPMERQILMNQVAIMGALTKLLETNASGVVKRETHALEMCLSDSHHILKEHNWEGVEEHG